MQIIVCKNSNNQISRVRNSLRAFTLTELIITVVIISMIAAFAIPSYQKAVRRSYERKAILHLTTIHGANEIYKERNGGYLTGAGLNLAGINSGLSLNIIDTDMTYFYTLTDAGAGIYNAKAAWTGGNNFTIRINNTPIVLAAYRPDSIMEDTVKYAWINPVLFIEYMSDQLVPPAFAMMVLNPCCFAGSCPSLSACP